MGRFDGFLLCSDLDGTILPHSGIIPERNLDALRYFMEEGGRFGIATGRARQTFAPVAEKIQMNAPAILANGSLIYDFDTQTVLRTDFLPESGAALCQEMLRRYPDIAVEAHLPESIYVINPNRYSEAHERLLKIEHIRVDSTAEIPQPWLKALFVGGSEALASVEAEIKQGYGKEFGIFLSHPTLLELQSLTANKGEGVAWLAEHLGCSRVFTAGDYDNDISMLTRFVGFAPANAREGVRAQASCVVCDCADGALADVIGILERMTELG